MDKKRVILLAFVIFSLVSISNSFAQGCCMSADFSDDLGCRQLTQSQCSAEGGEYLDEVSCSQLEQCQMGCFSCQNQADTSLSQTTWTNVILGCPLQNYNLLLPRISSITSENQCTTANIPPAQAPAIIKGTIRDGSATGPVVSNAIVQCGGVSNTSASNGEYTLVGCALTSTAVEAFASGKSGLQSLPGTLSAGQTVNGVNVIISAAPTTTFTVTVKNEQDQLVSNANITITDAGNNHFSQKTTSSGSVSFLNVRTGVATIRVSAPSYGTRTNATIVGTSHTFILSQVPTVQVSGTILNGSHLDSSGNPQFTVPNAIVKLLDQSQNEIASTTASAAGVYTLDAPAGTNAVYQIVAQKGSATGSLPNQQFELSGSYIQRNVVIGQSAPATTSQLPIQIRIVDLNGNAISGASVSIPPFISNLLSADDGYVSYNLAPNSYVVSVNHQGYKQKFEVITVGATTSFTISLTPKRALTISGRVINTTNNPIPSARITSIESASGTTLSTGTFSVTLSVDDSLVTEFPLFAKATGYHDGAVVVRLLPNQNTYAVGDIILQSARCTSPGDIQLSLAGSLTGSDVSLAWQSSCIPVSYSIERIRNADAAKTIANALTGKTFTDEDVEGNATYRYTVKATYDLGYTTITVISNEVVIATGSAQCMLGQTNFCDGNTKVECVGGSDQRTSCGNDVCVELSEGATCVASATCSLCNRPFSSFSRQVGQSSSAALFGGKGFTVPLFQVSSATLPSQKFFCSAPVDSVACYLDYSTTVVDKYQTCKEVTSCYDYLSEAACGQHKCTPSADCEWVDAYAELGVGVCRPAETEEQNCNEFSARSSTANAVFGSAADVCQLYGDSCYFSSVSNKCLNPDEVSCYDYNDRLDCLGVQDTNAVVDVDWKKNDTNYVYNKYNGTNEITQVSDDVFGRNICKFASNGCVRDADDNIAREDKYSLLGGAYFLDEGRDCIPGDRTCDATDVTPPATSLSAYDNQFVKQINVEYSVADASKSSKTYFRLINPTEDLDITYPNRVADELIVQDIPGTPEGEVWTLNYFSEDYENNLESVQSVSLIVDKKAPQINFSYKIVPHLDRNTVDFIPLLFLPVLRNADASLNDQLAYCINEEGVTGLYEIAGSTPQSRNNKLQDSTIGLATRTNWTETYLDVPTGENGIIAEYKWLCYDRAGNQVSGSKRIRLDADGLISNPQPQDAVGTRQNIPISIESQFPADCRFSENANYAQFGTWQQFTPSAQLTTHTATANSSRLFRARRIGRSSSVAPTSSCSSSPAISS